MIAIKNMTMPENCYECPLEHHNDCNASSGYSRVESIGRPEWCPLIEIPDDAIIFSEKMCCLARGIGEPLIAHYYSSEELERLWERATSNAPRNPEDAYREDFGKEKEHE